MDRDLRREIEACDFALAEARAELAAARELTAELPQEHEAKRAALEAQLAAILAALETQAAREEEFENERALLRHEISEGRSAVSRLHPPGPFLPEDPPTSLKDVVRPAGWRQGQPWYSRLLWWVLRAKEWK